MPDSLLEALAARGFTIDEEVVNSRGRVQLFISGPGLDRFPMYQDDAQELAAGRLTPEQLHENRERLARSRE
jgi:hypothetical protein